MMRGGDIGKGLSLSIIIPTQILKASDCASNNFRTQKVEKGYLYMYSYQSYKGD